MGGILFNKNKILPWSSLLILRFSLLNLKAFHIFTCPIMATENKRNRRKRHVWRVAGWMATSLFCGLQRYLPFVPLTIEHEGHLIYSREKKVDISVLFTFPNFSRYHSLYHFRIRFSSRKHALLHQRKLWQFM